MAKKMRRYQEKGIRDYRREVEYCYHFKPFPISDDRHDFEDIIRRMERMNRSIARTFYALVGEEIPDGQDYTLEELASFSRSCMRNQRGEVDNIRDSWSVVPSFEDREGLIDFLTGMPPDAWEEFVMQPTYHLLSLLSFIMETFPDIPQGIPGYEEGLRKGCDYVGKEGLYGRGFGGVINAISAVELFQRGKVISLLAAEPEFSPHLRKMLISLREYIEGRLARGETKGGKVDYEDGSKEVEKVNITPSSIEWWCQVEYKEDFQRTEEFLTPL